MPTGWPNNPISSSILGVVDAAEALANKNIINVTETSQSTTQAYSNGEQTGAVDGPEGKPISALGVDSLFNPFYVFRYAHFAKGANAESAGSYDFTRHTFKYHDASHGADALHEERRKIIENPTATVILEWARKNGTNKEGPLFPYPYQANDFLWCKFNGKIPNNRLLTLRRYPIPVEDNLAVADNNLPLVPIAQAVTWFGGETGNSLDKLLGITYGFNWESKPFGEVQDVAGNEVDASKVLETLGVKNETLRQAIQLIFFQNPNNPHQASGFDATLQEYTKESWKSGAYWNRVLGPVNVIEETQIRKRGYSYEHPITLDFEYTMRSYDNINPKIAMLDLISNFLSLTYNRASFWGGAYRYFQKTGFIAVGLNNEKLEQGNYVGGLPDLLAQAGSSLVGQAAGLKTFIDTLNTQLSGVENLDQALAEIGKTAQGNAIVQDVVASRLAGLMQKPLVLRALLDGRAVGEWHLTIGNPMDPIAVMGNLCLKTTKISFTDELGDSDFPVGIKFSVTLTPGRGRAKQDIESMFNMGGGDLGFTRLQDPSSAFNTVGEYNSIRLLNARGGQVSQTTGQPSGAVASAAQTQISISDQTKAISEFFSNSVDRAYGPAFSKSKILPSYFQELKTKD